MRVNGPVIANSHGYVFDSSIAAWIADPKTAAGAAGASSTQVAVSSLAGSVIVRSSAADALGTVYQSSFADLRATVHNSTIGDLLASVQQNSSVWQVQAGSTNWPKAAGLSVDSSNVQNVKLDGSTAITIGSIAAGAGRLSIGSTASENAVLATPVSTVFIKSMGCSVDSSNAQNVKLDGSTVLSVQQNSSVWQVQAGSTAFIKNAGLSVDSSNALNVKLDGSTRINLGSSAADNAVTTTPAAGSTQATRPLQSSASDLKVSAFLFDSTGNAIETSTFAASTKTSTVRGLMVRQAVPDCTSATVRLAASGDNAVMTSAATTIHVYAVSVNVSLGSTGPSSGSSGALIQFQQGTTGQRMWSHNYQLSSLMTFNASYAVTPPAYLFRSGAGNSINAVTNSSGGYVSMAAWRE